MPALVVLAQLVGCDWFLPQRRAPVQRDGGAEVPADGSQCALVDASCDAGLTLEDAGPAFECDGGVTCRYVDVAGGEVCLPSGCSCVGGFPPGCEPIVACGPFLEDGGYACCRGSRATSFDCVDRSGRSHSCFYDGTALRCQPPDAGSQSGCGPWGPNGRVVCCDSAGCRAPGEGPYCCMKDEGGGTICFAAPQGGCPALTRCFRDFSLGTWICCTSDLGTCFDRTGRSVCCTFDGSGTVCGLAGPSGCASAACPPGNAPCGPTSGQYVCCPASTPCCQFPPYICNQEDGGAHCCANNTGPFAGCVPCWRRTGQWECCDLVTHDCTDCPDGGGPCADGGSSLRPNGRSCSYDRECASGICVREECPVLAQTCFQNSICCDRRCSNPCETCFGDARGQCRPIADGGQRLEEGRRCPPCQQCGLSASCVPSPASSIDPLCRLIDPCLSERCDGTGRCRPKVDGAPCGLGCSSDGLAAIERACSSGVCRYSTGEVISDCGNYVCRAEGRCESSCSPQYGCQWFARCENASCVLETDGGTLRYLATGSICNESWQCLSGFCVEGICCDRRCDAPCQSCRPDGVCRSVASGNPGNRGGACRACVDGGTCAPKPAGSLDYRCAASAPTESGGCERGGLCDGDGGCGAWPDGTRCTTSTWACTDTGTVRSAHCQSGVCESMSFSCFPYQCLDTISCRTRCVGNIDCATGAACRDGGCAPI